MSPETLATLVLIAGMVIKFLRAEILARRNDAITVAAVKQAEAAKVASMEGNFTLARVEIQTNGNLARLETRLAEALETIRQLRAAKG